MDDPPSTRLSHPSHLDRDQLKARIEACIYNSALGDAGGYLVEFEPYEEIMRRQPGIPSRLVISDDTQMALYTIQAVRQIVTKINLNDVRDDPSAQYLARKEFADSYLVFGHDPANDRAPGMTCMESIYLHEGGALPLDGPVHNDSLGAGTIMRAPWLGLLNLDADTIAALSVLQSQVTHGHPLSWVSAATCSVLVKKILCDGHLDSVADLMSALRQSLDVVASLTLLSGYGSSIDELASLIDEMSGRWDEFAADSGNPCDYFGEGCIANEALMTSFAVFMRSRNDPFACMRDLCYTSGDSDTLGAIGGAMCGVYNGDKVFGYFSRDQFEPRYVAELAEQFSYIWSTWN